MNDGHARRGPRKRIWISLALVAGIASVYGVDRLTRWPNRRLEQARTAAIEGRHQEAERIARSILEWWPDWAAARMIAAEAAVVQQQYTRAVDDWDHIPHDGSPRSLACRVRAAEVTLTSLHRLSDAERRLRAILDRDPDDMQAQRLLTFLMDVCGRHFESLPSRLVLLWEGNPRRRDLRTLIERQTPEPHIEFIDQCLRKYPDDPLTRLSVAVTHLRQGGSEQAELLLRESATTAPDLIEAQVRLGQLLWNTGDEAGFQTWISRLPESVRRHPQAWALRGDLARQQDDLQIAARCYWESLRRDSCYQRSAYQLGQLLISLGEPGRAEPFVERAARLQHLAATVKQFSSTPNAALLEEVVIGCQSLGLLWEERAWSQLALETDPRLVWAREHLERLDSLLVPGLPRTAPEANPALVVDLSDFPLPDWNIVPHATPSTSDSQQTGNIRFADDARAAGIDFRYFNDDNPDTPAARPFEFTGGGVAVLDYDGDGWPDLYLTQGCAWPRRPQQREQLDRLYRNLGNGRFRDVTSEAGLIENSYSQGVTVGDSNSDGFPDLYVANLDANRLFRNNGDGTFSDVSIESATGGDRWTTSCLLADLNGDAWPDIYAVNYLAGSDVFERICRSSQGRPRICTPNDFAASQDQLYLNLGDGRFEEWTDEGGITLPHGKGLGIIAWDVDGSGRLNLFVANDTDSNSYFVNETPGPGEPPLFRDAAVSRGLAFDQNGLPQACMGIAVGDADADGRLDLFVTNYYQEANTLYLQQPGQLFYDATHEAGLRQPSLPMLGFGTQFLDADLDGEPDLVAVNGHVEDQRDRGIPYQMRPQFFSNLGSGRFIELTPESLGSYFETASLGRGLARLDWNRDGREDFAVSHLDQPAALLTNQSVDVGHFLALRLCGTRSSRDAIGTTVRVSAGERTWVQQLTAGDGYQASNERKLTFGLGTVDEVDAVTLKWPSGLAQVVHSAPVDVTLIAVEGRPALLVEDSP